MCEIDSHFTIYSKNTSYNPNKLCTVVSYCVCHCQSLPPKSNICWKGWSLP